MIYKEPKRRIRYASNGKHFKPSRVYEQILLNKLILDIINKIKWMIFNQIAKL